MRLGGPVFGDTSDPEGWVRAVTALGYRAAYCPLEASAADDVVRAYERAARDADIVIAEVGAWSNPLSPDEKTRREAVEHCTRQLDLADRIGARCCVNIAGSRCTQSQQWDGHDPANLTDETFDMIVGSVRGIIDSVKPARTCYTLETMPWMYPDSPESYARLLHAIDRPRFAVHLDPVNLISSPQRYYSSAEVIRACFRLLGPHVKSCHAKDISLSGRLTVHLDEARPGQGNLDYSVFLRELAKLDPDTPLMLEHLPSPEEYALAAGHIRTVAHQNGMSLDD